MLQLMIIYRSFTFIPDYPHYLPSSTWVRLVGSNISQNSGKHAIVVNKTLESLLKVQAWAYVLPSYLQSFLDFLPQIVGLFK